MTLRLRAGVVLSGRDGAWYATDLASGAGFELNATAMRVLETLRTGADAAACVRGLRAAHPDVPADEVERDVRALLADLLAAGLLEATQ